MDIQGSIWHGQVIHDLIKLDKEGQFDYVGIIVILEHILGCMWIIHKKDSFGDMVLQLGYYLSRGSYIDITYKVHKGVRVILILYSFINRINNFIRIWKVILKSYRMVQGIWPKFDVQVGSSYHSSYIVS